MILKSFHWAMVELREGTTDEQTLRDAEQAEYHVPPVWMPEPRTILDLGSNIGLTCLDYSYLWQDAIIIGVEMDDENAGMAMRNWPGGRIVTGAVVASMDDERGYDPSLPKEAFALGSGPQRPAERYTMRTLLGLFGSAPVDFVKMDVEGTEWDLLEDGEEWAPLVRHLLVELHNAPPDAARLRGAMLLNRLGFDSEPSTHPAGLFAWRSEP